jgi:hypothetical protein
MKTIKIYLASSKELDDDRIEFGNLIRRLDEIYERRGVRIRLIETEAGEGVNEEDESSKCIGESDMFLALFHLEAGRYTVEEFNRATEEFKLHSSPKVYAYMKSVETGEEETDELKDFKHHLLEEIGHYWCKYRNTDTMQLHFVMQLQLLESHPSVELKIKDEKALLDGEEVADLSKVPFVSLNKGFQKLKEDIEELDEDMADIRIDLKEDPDNERKKVKLLKKSERRNALAKELEQTQDFLFQTAMKFNSLMGRSCTRRIIKAKELLDEGKAEEANAVLDIGDIDRDAEINIKAYEQAKEDLEAKRENVIKSIEEYTVKASTVMTDSSIPNMSERCDQACDAYKKAIDLGKRVNYDKEKLANILFDSAKLHQDFNHFSESEILYKETLLLYRQLEGKRSHRYFFGMACILNNLGNLHSSLHHYEEAEKEYKESLDIQRYLASMNPDTYLSEVAMSLSNIGAFHRKTRRYEESEKELQESLKILRLLLTNNPDTFLPDIADVLENIGNLHCDLYRYEEAETDYKESLQIYRSFAEKSPNIFLSSLASILENIGNLYSRLCLYDKSEKNHMEAQKIYQQLAAYNSEMFLPDLALTYNNLGILHRNLCLYKESEMEYNKALEIRQLLAKKSPETYLPEVAANFNNLGILHSTLHRYENAEKEHLAALEIFRQLARMNPDAFSSDLAENLKNIGHYYGDLCLYEEALKAYQESENIYRSLVGRSGNNYVADLVACLGDLSFYLLFFKRAQESEEKAKEALSIDNSQLWIYTNLISSYVMQNKFEEADNTIPKIQNEKEQMNALFSDWQEFEERGLFTAEQKAYIEKKKKKFEHNIK